MLQKNFQKNPIKVLILLFLFFYLILGVIATKTPPDEKHQNA